MCHQQRNADVALDDVISELSVLKHGREWLQNLLQVTRMVMTTTLRTSLRRLCGNVHTCKPSQAPYTRAFTGVFRHSLRRLFVGIGDNGDDDDGDGGRSF